ncbi:hypothetical protein MFU01_41290 [Myxococcus fulvus]|uniref:Uncharacterized protein n=1 Tax=Myxococcus fulvus TaxID=33 RepID=A0A511T6F3_MYXFU|nr:hypothetical protein MFU01_41290 [Myxococcus fulvus]
MVSTALDLAGAAAPVIGVDVAVVALFARGCLCEAVAAVTNDALVLSGGAFRARRAHEAIPAVRTLGFDAGGHSRDNEGK